MALRPFYNITIKQIPTQQWKDRKSAFTMNFVTEYQVVKGWEDHTDTCTVKFPKNVVVQSGEYLFQQRGTFNVVVGGSGYILEGYNFDNDNNNVSTPPLILRGDYIEIEHGYYFFNKQRKQKLVKKTIFKGFVSKVNSDVPIELSCEDFFYLLKKTPFNQSTYSGNLLALVKDVCSKVNTLFGSNQDYNISYTLNGKQSTGNVYQNIAVYPKLDELAATFTLGHFDIGDITCAQVLARLKDQYHLKSFFTVDEKTGTPYLHFGYTIYDEERSDSSAFFEFENNIHDGHNLEYKNKDDVILSAIVSCQSIVETGKVTKAGKAATKKERKSCLVYWDIPTETFKSIIKKKGEPFPPNDSGERHEFVYPVSPYDAEPTDKQLADFGTQCLEKYYYTGFRGDFTSFGYPFVDWNDNVNLMSNTMSDRNGQYLVKKVVYTGGIDKGIKQQIFIERKNKVKLPYFKEYYYG